MMYLGGKSRLAKPITRLIVSPKEIGWMTIAELAESDESEAER